MSERRRCIHCHNPVEEIKYRGTMTATSAGIVQNVFKHGYPREYTVCSKSPITEEDVEWVNDEV